MGGLLCIFIITVSMRWLGTFSLLSCHTDLWDYLITKMPYTLIILILILSYVAFILFSK